MDAYFWSTHGGAELDLLLFKNGHRFGFELKLADAPKVTRAMYESSQTLGLEHLWVVYPREHSYPLAEGVTALPLKDVPAAIAEWEGP